MNDFAAVAGYRSSVKMKSTLSQNKPIPSQNEFGDPKTVAIVRRGPIGNHFGRYKKELSVIRIFHKPKKIPNARTHIL